MLLFLRKAVFYPLLILYCLVTPYTILYALGYLISPEQRTLVKTGLVSVISFPRHARVFIEGKKFSKATPTVVSDLLPGKYHVRVVRKGFGYWEKEIEIEPEKATQLEPVLLLPHKPDADVISHHAFANMVPGTPEAKILAWQNPQLDSLWKIDLFFKRETLLSRELDIRPGVSIVDILYREKSPVVLFLVEAAGKRQFFIFQPGREKKMAESLNELLPTDADWIDWNPKNASQIYFLKDGFLSRLDLNHEKIYPPIHSDVLGFGVHKKHLYVLKKDYSLLETGPEGENPDLLLESETLGTKIFSGVSARYFQIEVLDRDLLVFLSDQGALISNRLPYHHVDQGVRGVSRSHALDEEKVLFWTGHEIGAIDFQREKETLFEKEPEEEIFYAGGKDIQQAFWAYEDSHVIFLDRASVFLLEVKGPKPYLLREIVRVKPDSRIYYHEGEHALYYIDAQSRNLVKRKIVE